MPEIEICKERVYSEEYRDYIVGRVGTFWREILEQDICSFPLENGFQIIYATQEELNGTLLYEVPYYSIPKCYNLLDTEALEETGIARVQVIPGLELTGQNVIIGFIDTGIHYEADIFRRLDGSTRILRIWDQTIENGKVPEKLWYGSEYTETEINQALHAENPESIVPSKDEIGHGTFVASIACGGGVPEQEFLGAAPEADIVMVKLKGAKQYLRDYYFIREGTPCYQENDIMAALFYLKQVARKEGKPLVICMSLGTSMGGHSGAAPLSAYLEVLGNIPLIAITSGTGNEADQRHHMQGVVSSDAAEQIEVNVASGGYGFFAELWTEIPNVLTVTITSPSGETSFQAPIRSETSIYEFLFEETKVYINYRVLVESTNAQVIFLRFENAMEGVWKVNVTAQYLGDGRYHMWLPVKEFLSGDVFFLNSDPEYTILGPGNVQAVSTVSFYDGVDGSIDVRSGRGPTRIERLKPDLAAPGVNVLGLSSREKFVRRTGASIAAAFAAGAAALLMEWCEQEGKTPDSMQIKNLLILGARKTSTQIYPNTQWGYGQMDLYNTFLILRNI